MLCLTPYLFISYRVSNTRHFIALHWIWYSYHNYVGNFIWCRIFWWFYQSPSSSSSHFSCFFRQVRLPFYNSDYCPHILGMLGLDYSYTCHLFIARWSPYFSGCNNTCWDWHFPVLDNIRRCQSLFTPSCSFLGFTFWKFIGLILSLVVSFFGGSLTWVGICFTFNRCSFIYYANTYSLMCKSKGKHLVINSSYPSPFLYNTMYLTRPQVPCVTQKGSKELDLWNWLETWCHSQLPALKGVEGSCWKLRD